MASLSANRISGPLVNVVERPVGTVLILGAAATETELFVSNPDDLDWEGGTLLIGEEQIVYTLDATIAGRVALASALAASYDEDTPVYDFPVSYERIAFFKEAGTEEELEARVPISMWDRVPLGSRDPDSEVAVANRYGGEFVLYDLSSVKPSINLSGLLTEEGGGTPSDGLAPPTSPTPTVRGGLGWLAVWWEAVENADPVSYEVHVSLVNDFTPDATTFVGSVLGTAMFIREEPDGTELEYGTTYHVKLIARDEDGSAAPGLQDAALLEQVTGPDIAANAIIANHILAGEITAEKLQAILVLSSMIRTANSGQRVEISPDGIQLIASDGVTVVVDLPVVGDPYFAGEIDATGLSMEENPSGYPPLPTNRLEWEDAAGVARSWIGGYLDAVNSSSNLRMRAGGATARAQAIASVEAASSDASYVQLLLRAIDGATDEAAVEINGSKYVIARSDGFSNFLLDVPNSVDATNIAAGAVGSDEIAADAVGGSELAGIYYSNNAAADINLSNAAWGGSAFITVGATPAIHQGYYLVQIEWEFYCDVADPGNCLGGISVAGGATQALVGERLWTPTQRLHASATLVVYLFAGQTIQAMAMKSGAGGTARSLAGNTRVTALQFGQ
jgi:hypothetical protein